MQVDHSRALWSLLVFMTWYETWRQLRVGAGTPFDATTPSTMPLSAANGLASHDP
jgi:hypothetical protein